jgi:uncharacterized DUF497 family protein
MGWSKGPHQSHQASGRFQRCGTHLPDGAAAHLIDETAAHGEERIRAVGLVDGIVLMVIYVERGDRIRLISVRKATKREANDHIRERWSGID